MMKNIFPAELIKKASFYFRTVYNDGDRVRIWLTGWQYETETVFRSAADLEKYISEHEQQILEEFDFMEAPELRELGLLW